MAEYLNGEEEWAYFKDIRSLMLSTLSGVIAIADRYNVDRDNAMEHFATVFKVMQEVSTFSEFGAEQED